MFLALSYILLQAAQAPQEISQTTLLAAMGVGLAAIGSLIAWVIKTAFSLFPKALEQAEKRTDALTKAVDAFPAAITGIKDLVMEVRNETKATIAKDGADTRFHISKEVDTAKDHIVSVIQDRKFKDLEERLSQGPESSASFKRK